MPPIRPDAKTSASYVLPVIGELRAPRISPPTRATLLRGILAFRWLAGSWMVAVFAWEVWDRRNAGKVDVAHPVAGAVLLLVAVAFMAWLSAAYRRDSGRLAEPTPIVAEIGLASVLLFADMWVYGSTHSQALPTIWPLGVIFTVAIAAGTRPAVITGLGLGACRYLGWLIVIPEGDSVWSMTRIASTVLFTLGGWVAGYLVSQQAEADRSISAFRAREEVARTLHDGVLQTLAVIQRRSDDAELVELARSQELELRQYLFDGSGDLHGAGVDDDLAATLRAVSLKVERRDGLRVDVICAPDLPSGDRRAVHALGGAVAEALTNAAKHGRAEKATVYAEPGDEDDEVFVSVKDNGVGFDPDAVTRGQGLDGSITARLTDAGGRVEIDGRPGRGAEIRMWL